MKLYILLFASILIMPFLVLYTERYFQLFILALSYPAFLFAVIIYVYIKINIKHNFNYLFFCILTMNFFSNIIVSFSGGILVAVLGMAHYDGPTNNFTDISFFSWFICMMIIVFVIIFYLLFKPFVNYLDKSIRKMKKSATP